MDIDEIDFDYGTEGDKKKIFSIIEKSDIDQIIKIFEEVNQCFYFKDFQFNIAWKIYDFFEKKDIYNSPQYHERIVKSILTFLQTKTPN